MGFAQEKLGFQNPPKLFFKQDAENAKDILGKTAHYDPQNQSVTVFVTNRHPKDILRSLAHELVHHVQNLRGDLSPEKCGEMGPGYAQTNPHLREMEREAFERGNLCFRDWSDEYKKQQQEVKFLKESKKMANKLTKNKLEGLIRSVLKEIKLKEEVSDPAPRLPSRYDVVPSPADLDQQRYVKLPKAAKDQERFLNRVGFSDIQSLQNYVDADLTGQYDKQTYDAIKNFQRKIGLRGDAVDGVFGPGTLRRLRAKRLPRPQDGQAVKMTGGIGADADRKMVKRKFKEPAVPSADTDSLADIAGVDPGLIKKDKVLPTGFQIDPLADEDENADRYERFTRAREAFEESNNPFAEGNCGKRDDLEEMGCGGKGKRDDVAAKKEVLDEEEVDERQQRKADRDPSSKGNTELAKAQKARGMNVKTLEEGEDQKCEKCKNCKCPGGGKACDRCKNCKCDEKDSKKKSGKKNMVKGPDGKLVPDYAVDGKGSKDLTKVAEGSKIYTPEQEQTLYESRFNDRNQQIFDKLKKLWTK